MTKIYLLLSLLICFSSLNICIGQTPNFSIVSYITAPGTINQYDCYSITVKLHNDGSTGTYDFECDLNNSNNTVWYRLIEKKCSNYILANNDVTLTFSTSSTSTNANHHSIEQSPGSYSIKFAALSSSCFQCGNTGCYTQYLSGSKSLTIQSASCSGYCMSSTPVSTCTGTFYDSGGDGNYGNSLNIVKTFTPSTSGNKLRFSFSSFSIENNWDYLYIYDGANTSSSLIGSYTGTSSPSTITATNANGQLTFKFTSDGSNNCSTGSWYGWQASISCVSNCTGVSITSNPSDKSVTQPNSASFLQT